MEQEERCDGCKFYRPHLDKDGEVMPVGDCRRQSPAALSKDNANGQAEGKLYVGLWPCVEDDEWCGEWVERKSRMVRHDRRYRVDRKNPRQDFRIQWSYIHYREEPPNAAQYKSSSTYRFREEWTNGEKGPGEWVEFRGTGAG